MLVWSLTGRSSFINTSLVFAPGLYIWLLDFNVEMLPKILAMKLLSKINAFHHVNRSDGQNYKHETLSAVKKKKKKRQNFSVLHYRSHDLRSVPACSLSPARPHKNNDSIKEKKKRPIVTFTPSSGRSDYDPEKRRRSDDINIRWQRALLGGGGLGGWLQS